jgi:hypothetical protein
VEKIVENIHARRSGLGTVVEVRFQLITEDQKLVGAFITKINHDKSPSECLMSQIPRYVLP